MYRLAISHKHLLEWMTSEEAEKQSKTTIGNYYKMMFFNVILGGITIVVSAIINNILLTVIGILWIITPYIMYKISSIPEKTKKELRKIVDMMKNNDRLIRIGARPIKGIALYGESGTGKTLTAKILSNEIDSKFIYKSGSEFKGKYQSEGCEKVKKLFEEARN